MSFEYKALSFTSSFKMFLLWGSFLIRYYKLQGCGLHVCVYVCVCVYGCMYMYHEFLINPCVRTMNENLSFDDEIRQTMNGMTVPNQRSKLKPD